jgi:hypothetical protein
MLYLYGLVDQASMPRGEHLGIGGAELTCIEHRDIYILCSQTDRKHYSPDIALLQVHNEVLSALIETATVLPFSFGTVVVERDDIKKYIDLRYPLVRQLLDECRGKAELGLKVFTKCQSPELPVLREMPVHTGADYIRKLYHVYKSNMDRIDDVKNQVTPLLARLEELSCQQCYQWRESGSLIFDGAFLVPKGDWSRVVNLIDGFIGVSEISSYVSGPWPPYSFMGTLSEEGR